MARSTLTITSIRRGVPLALLVLAVACGGGSSSTKTPPLGTVESLEVTPGAVMLRDASSAVSVEVTGITDTGRTVDLTASTEGTTYASSDTAVADVTAEGVVSAQGPGTATLTVTNGTIIATAPIYSDMSAPLTEGDFDLVGGEGPVRKGETVTIPLVLDGGSKTFGSYRVLITFEQSHFEFVRATEGADLGDPLAVRSDTPGQVEILDAYSPDLGQTLTGPIEAVRIVLRAVGDPGDASLITGSAVEVFDTAFPAAPIGPAVPRPFVTGVRWLAID